MRQETGTRDQWSRDSCARVSTCVVVIVLAWWPVAEFVRMAAVCRYLRWAELAGQYILAAGVPSWLLALALVATWPAEHGGRYGKWVVFAGCFLPLPLIFFRVHLLVVQFV